jgi:hypothetical protein
MSNPLRIPTWLLALTVVAIVGALIRVVEIRGATGIAAFLARFLLPVALAGFGIVAADKFEARSPKPLWPSSKARRRVFLAVLIVTDLGCIFMLALGSRFIDAFDI